ncbi:MAG: hypothetical protein HFI08_04645 [Bacilli bacterium]|jgi:hypothetical protein|nr:hypothetical protein [Bacilli bacterium]
MKKKPTKLSMKIFYFMGFTILIVAFIFLGTRNYTVKEVEDAILFSKEYRNISHDNHFQVLSSYETLNLLERGTGLLFFGFSENEWSSAIAELLDQVSREMDYSVAYYNFLEDRNKKHDNYQGIVREVDQYLVLDDLKKMDLHAPLVVGVIKGNVVFFDDETSFTLSQDNPKSYWTEEKKLEKKEEYREVIRLLQKENQ